MSETPSVKPGRSPRPSLSQIESELLRRRKKGAGRRAVFRFINALIIVAAVTVLITMLWLPVMQVLGTSMSPYMRDGDLVLVTKDQSKITHGDIIAFYFNDKILVKRVIGMPGDEIYIDEDGDVYVNGIYLDETYVKNKTLAVNDTEYPVTVPANSYFVLGDNRPVSVDSRSADLGMVYGDRVAGKVIYRLWPFGRVGRI